MNNRKIIAKFAAYLKALWLKEFALLGLLLVANAAALASPYALKIIIDNVFPTSDYRLLVEVLIVLVAVYIVRILAAFAADVLYAWVGNQIMYKLRMDLFEHVAMLPLKFYDENKVGEIVHRVNNEVEKVQGILTGSVIRLLNNFFTIATLAAVLLYLNYKLFFVGVILFPLVLLSTRYFHPRIQSAIQKSREQDADILAFFSERFNNIKLIKSFNAYGFENLELKKLLTKYISTDLYFTRTWSLSQNISTFCVALSPVLILAWGGWDVMNGLMTLGSLVAFIQYINRLFPPFRDLMSLYTDAMKALASMRRIFEIMDTPTEEIRVTSAKTAERNHWQVEFRHVQFGFCGREVFHDLNLKLESARRYAIVGRSGCGKSTLVKLLFGFYNPGNGEVRINGMELSQLGLDLWRQKIAFVGQEPLFYHGSVKDNVRYAATASQSEIERVCMITGAHDFISRLETGYDTMLGDRGVKISGGQQQRINIARALLKEHEILVLDEATSALDSESEAAIMQNIYRCYPNTTTIIISHRLSAIRLADQVIYLDGGKVFAQGTFESMASSNVNFYQLFESQIIRETARITITSI